MRKRYISEEELNKIIKLNGLGASWLKIQKETKIPRRSAKRAYDEYMRSKSVDELKAARLQIVSEQFNAHMQDLISFARSLVSNIGEPTVGDTKTAEEVMDEILKIDVRTQRIRNPLTGKTNASTELVIRQNKILLQSLKVHTREKVEWKTLDEWGKARNIWINNTTKLQKEAVEIISNFAQGKQYRETIEKEIGRNNLSAITEGIVNAITRAILIGKVGEAEDLVQIIPDERGVRLTFSGDTSGKLIRYEDEELAEEVRELARQAIRNLRAVKDSEIGIMANSLKVMRNKKSELEDMLEELRLIPIILSSKCDICPAL